MSSVKEKQIYVDSDGDEYTTDFGVFLESLKKPKTVWRTIDRFLYRFYDTAIDPKNWLYRFKRLIRWVEWGFNPKDIWSLDHTTSKWILPRLMKLKEVKHGVPSGMHELIVGKGMCLENNSTEQWQELEKAWDEILCKMIKSFQMVVDDDWGNDYFKWQRDVDEGLKLFAEYFLCLWD